MQLESHEVAEIIDKVRRRMIVAAAAAAMDDGSEEARNGAAEFAKLINHYTGDITRAIQRAEDEKTGAMVDDMAEGME